MRHNLSSSQIHQLIETELSLERQREIEASYEAAGGTYCGVWIRNRQELLWIFSKHGWTGEAEAEGLERAKLSGAILRGVDLRGMALNEADLSGARIDHAILIGASLVRANLSGTDFHESDLQGASLFRAVLLSSDLNRANLDGADLGYADARGVYLNHASLIDADLVGIQLLRASLCNADLHEARVLNGDMRYANLSGSNLRTANLVNADLRGANLSDALLDQTTRMYDVRFDAQTCLCDVSWGGVSLTRINWSDVPVVGEEKAIARTQDRKTRVQMYHDAARAYSGLAVALRAEGLNAQSGRFHLLEQRMDRRALFAERKYIRWFLRLVLNLITGYGERPLQVFVLYLCMLALFSVLYHQMSQVMPTPEGKLSWDESAVLSLTSFHGRAFFTGNLRLNDWLARVEAAEGAVGLYVEAIFIATFSRKFLGS